MFFAVLALWLAVRAMELRRGRDWVLTAIAIGLAISSRYIFATLVGPYVVAAALSVRWTRHGRLIEDPDPRDPRSAGCTVRRSAHLRPVVAVRPPRGPQLPDRRQRPSGADGLSPIGNFLWYVAPSRRRSSDGRSLPSRRSACRPRAEPSEARGRPRRVRRLLPRRRQRFAAPLGPLHHPAGPGRRHLCGGGGAGDGVRRGRSRQPIGSTGARRVDRRWRGPAAIRPRG